MMVDDGGGRGVKNGRKSDDVINGRPLTLSQIEKNCLNSKRIR